MRVKIASLVAAANGAPSGLVGIPLRGSKCSPDTSFAEYNDGEIVVEAVGTSTGALAFTGYLWGYLVDAAKWQRFAALNAASTAITTAQSVPATAPNALNYAENVSGFRHFDRLYLEITAVAGTTPQFDAYLVAKLAKDWSC